MEVKIQMKMSKSTPGTHVYAADTSGGQRPLVRTVYLDKQALGDTPAPESIELTIKL